MKESVRLGAERRAVERLAGEEPWFRFDRWLLFDGKLSAEGVISAHGHAYPVRLVYPEQFPLVPAWVEPQEEIRWTTHQYGTGTLCLEHRPDNWSVMTTGVDVLRSAFDLFMTEDPLGTGGTPAPSAHDIGELQAYDWRESPVLVGAGCMERIREGRSLEPKALSWLIGRVNSSILVHDAEDREASRRPSEPRVDWWQIETPVFVSANSGPSGGTDREALLAAGAFPPDTLSAIPTDSASIVLFAGGDRPAAWFLPANDAPRLHRVFVLPDETGIRSGRTPGVESKAVAIVGAGSVGSKIADGLARSGVSRFLLIDGDVLLPDNLERHALDWRDVGLRKVEGLRRRILSIVPGGVVVPIPVNLNWQRSADTHSDSVSALACCDVIVDATGDPPTSLYLGALADANGRAFVSAEVLAGGVGGLVATCLPWRDPPYAVGRAAFLAWCEGHEVDVPVSGCRRYEALVDGTTPMVADDAAVTTTAAHAARVVLDILDGAPAPIGSAWLVLGYRRGWLFDGHGHNIRVCVGERARDENAERDDEALAFVEGLVEEVLGEAEPEV